MSKEQDFDLFFKSLINATEKITEKYFRLPVAYTENVFRERAYCYELYHQIRQLLPENFAYTLSGEVNKAGHPLIADHCGAIIPDFLVHNPGHMGPDDNLCIVEVKTIQGANYNWEKEDLLKDFNSINCMTSLENGYHKGIILIFGSDHEEKKTEIVEEYTQRCNTEKVILLFHENPLEKAEIILEY